MKVLPFAVALALALLLAWLARVPGSGSEHALAATPGAAAAPAPSADPVSDLEPVTEALDPTAGRASAQAPEPAPLAETPLAVARGLEDGARPPAVVPPELQPHGPTGARAD